MSSQERPSGLPMFEKCLHSIRARGVLGEAFFPGPGSRAFGGTWFRSGLAGEPLTPGSRHAGTVSFAFCWAAVRAASLGQGRSCHSIGRCRLSSRTHPSRFTRHPQE